MLCNDHKGRESVSIISTPFICQPSRRSGDGESPRWRQRSPSLCQRRRCEFRVVTRTLAIGIVEIWSLPRRMVDIHKLTACSSSSSQVARRHPDATSLWPPDACTTGLDHALTQGQEMTATQRSGSACAPRPEGAHG